MAEAEKNEEVVEQEVQVEQKQEVVKAPEYSAKEQQAMELGWRPKDDFDGDPEEWVSAREFLKRGELFGRINSYRHEIDNLTKTVNALKSHNEKMFEDQYKDEISKIKTARKQALREGDTEIVADLDDRLDEVEEKFEKKQEELKKQEEQQKQQASVGHPAFQPWVDANRWYANDAELRGYADGVANKIVQDARAASQEVEFERLLVEVSRKVKQRFPEKFPSGERKRTVERPSDDAKSKTSGLSADLKAIEDSLSEGDRDIMKTLVSNKTMTKTEYLTQLKEYNQRRGK